MRAFSLRKRGLCDLARGRGKAWPLSPPHQPAPAALRPSVLQAGTQQRGHSVLGGLCLPPFPSPGLSRWPTCHRPWSLRSLGAQPEAGAVGSTLLVEKLSAPDFKSWLCLTGPLSWVALPPPTGQPAPAQAVQRGTTKAAPADATQVSPLISHRRHQPPARGGSSSEEPKYLAPGEFSL